ncbi:MAG: type topoisomerase [Candidatus Parcubacteria bacterium]|jgi:DNA topoisomerase-1
MQLLIVESPAKAKTISKYVGKDYTVVASVGHVRDLPKSNKKAVDIDKGFKPHYEISKGKEKVVDEIKRLAKKATETILATDPDREGEAIAWHIAEAVGLKKPQRVVFHEITKDAVLEALKHPRTIDQNLRKAQEARRVLDRLVGYDLSGLIWKKVRYGLSAGRVQSPALRILMEREREIRAFIPETFWVLTADTETEKKDKLVFTCSEEPRDKKVVDEIVLKGNKEAWHITDVKETQAQRAPRPPFITSTLQQAASTRLGFSPSRTMGTAQKLYEAGHITYMRTDSTHLSTVAVSNISKLIETEFGKEYLSPRTYTTKSKNAQEAHEAIRPTHFEKTTAGLTDDQKKLYRLIWSRTVSSQMAPSKILRTKITANTVSNSLPEFATHGARILFDGWLKADPEARNEEVTLPLLKSQDPLTLLDLKTQEKQTEPPGRYSEAGLVKELEKRGIGRPSTYASIIRTLEERGYTEKEARSLKPTDTGDVVSTFLEHNFMEYINDTFTAEMEDKLDDIALGKGDYEHTLETFYKPFHKDVKAKEKTAKITNMGDAPEEFKCPLCNKDMVWKLGRGGKFMSCSNFPECLGARTGEGKVIEDAKPIGTDPTTNLPIFVLDGRFGYYVQLGEKTKEVKKPRRSSLPKEILPDQVTIPIALKLLSLPRILGNHPTTNEPITANIGRFGPYVVHQKDFRSLKTDDVYTIALPRALEIFAEEKKTRRGRFTKKKAD